MSAADLPKKNRLKPLLIALVLLVLAGFIALFIAYKTVLSQYAAIPDKPAGEVVYAVPAGAGLGRIAQDLEAQGLIESAFIMKAAHKIRNEKRTVKAGEFLIQTPASMAQIFDKLSEGQTIQYKLTLAEGLTSRQMMRLIEADPILIGDMPETPAEGTLLPETYLFPKTMTRKALVSQMQEAQTKLIDSLWESRDPDLPYKTKREAIIMASVIEKETGVSSERDHVAGVFVNRLRRGILLQTDPTIIYGITGGEPLGRGIRRSELDADTPWNSYKRAGLPPGPICNPGAAAIKAALNPMETEDLFFVADGSGGHAFAKTLREHNANVKNWRKIERRKRAEERRARQGQ